MVRRPRRHKRARRLLVAAIAVVFCVGAATAGVAGGRSLARRDRTTTASVEVDGQRRTVELIGPQTVTSVLIMAGVIPRDGRLLSIKTHKVLDPALDPARVELAGRAARPTDAVPDGGTITVVDGHDAIEGTRRLESIVPAPPLPDVMYHVQRRGKPGKAEQVRGLHSGELVSSRVLVQPVAPQQVHDKVVALTFDDGPTSQWTPSILAVLAEKGVKATFCEIGQMIGYHPEVTRQIVAAGHQLCNHTKDHVEHLDRSSHAEVEAQIGGGEAAQTALGLPAPEYYRPPGGSLGPDVTATARAHGEAVLYWKVDTEDWKTGATPTSILDHVKNQTDPGAIILMHDGGGKSRAVSILTLGLVIDWLRSQGYGFVFPLID